ncbi:hypothetical protein [Arthrobacter sp. Soil736]|uniref:hypothetical protein n=1 Tax=Arthrobacter sp. Soil736 TaxID=1736395 RepID=UPI000AA39CD9|nr:hypothetical protein [Arthrobacter sp. Soil736]
MADTIDLKTQAAPEFAHIISAGARLSKDDLVDLAARLLRGHENAFLFGAPRNILG